MGDRSKHMGERIGSAVMALQIGDITRQRIEHVEFALGLFNDVLLSKPGEGGRARRLPALSEASARP